MFKFRPRRQAAAVFSWIVLACCGASIPGLLADEPRHAPRPVDRSRPVRKVSLHVIEEGAARGAPTNNGAPPTSPTNTGGRPTQPAQASRKIIHKATVQMSFLDDLGESADGQTVVLRWNGAPPEAPSADAINERTTSVVSHNEWVDESTEEPTSEYVSLVNGPELLAPVAMRQSDAFEDPFGDRQAASSTTSSPRDRSSEPKVLTLEPRFGDATPILSMQGPSAPPREEITKYCEADGKSCAAFREKLRSRSIQRISLDISPDLNPPTSEWAESRQEAAMPSGETRAWRSARGGILATGTLAGYENGRVLVRDDQGGIQRLPYDDLGDADLCYFANLWRIPTECTLGHDEYTGRDFVPSTFAWKASSLCHKPLYFEEVQLERYGHTAGPLRQPVLSGAHFFLNIAVLPYRMGINPPSECRYPLGYYRPGSCAPWLVPPIPLSVRGGLMEAGAVLGGIYLIP